MKKYNEILNNNKQNIRNSHQNPGIKKKIDKILLSGKNNQSGLNDSGKNKYMKIYGIGLPGPTSKGYSKGVPQKHVKLDPLKQQLILGSPGRMHQGSKR